MAVLLLQACCQLIGSASFVATVSGQTYEPPFRQTTASNGTPWQASLPTRSDQSLSADFFSSQPNGSFEPVSSSGFNRVQSAPFSNPRTVTATDDDLAALKKEIKELKSRLNNLAEAQTPNYAAKKSSDPSDNTGQRKSSEQPQDGSTDPANDKPGNQPIEKAVDSKDSSDQTKKQEPTNGSKPTVPTDKWDVKLGGHIQMDYVMWPDADPAIIGARNYFNYRRLRLVADGVGYDQFDFRLQMTLEPGDDSNAQFASPDVKDAYISMNEIPGIGRFRVGNFFVPFSLEQVTNDTNNLFNERSIPTQGIFAADREVGMAIYNCSDDQNITWTTGIFFDNLSDTIKTRIDNNQGYRLAGRLTWLPFYDEASNGRYLIHTGLGILHTDDHDNRVRFRARPQVQRGPILIDSGDLAADSYTTGGLELAIVWGPVTLQNEAFVSNVNLLSGNSAVVGGAYSHVSYFLTGENRIFERFGQHGPQFARNRPYQNFQLKQCERGWGAWEAKARWSYLDLTRVNQGQYNDLTVGLNWYWSDRTRIMFDWIHPLTTADTVFGATESDLFALRLDVNW